MSFFQWTWERADIVETAKKTMYWDCLFMATAFDKNDYPPPTSIPGVKELALKIAKFRSNLGKLFP